MLEQIQKEKIEQFIEQKEKTTSIGQLNESLDDLGLDVKVGERLKNDKKMLTYAEHFLGISESGGILGGIKMQFLELRLSMTCPYFEDFKNFLSELKKGEDSKEKENDNSSDNIDVVVNNNEFMGTKISEIKSQPFYKNPDSGATRCAATARFNAKNFGLDLPLGDAYDAGTNPGDNSKETIPQNRKHNRPNSNWSALNIMDFPKADSDINFADIYTSSSSTYGHRVVGFKDGTGQWYVLDPYTRVNGKLDNNPKKIEDYAKNKKIIKSHFYKSSGYKFESRNYA